MSNGLCEICYQLEGEAHSLITCELYHLHRQDFYLKISARRNDFTLLNDHGKSIFLMSRTDPFILGLLAKFVYKELKNGQQTSRLKFDNSIITSIMMQSTTIPTEEPRGYHFYLHIVLRFVRIKFYNISFTINRNFF